MKINILVKLSQIMLV